MREAYRKNKEIVYDSEDTKKHIFMFIYQGKKEPEYQWIEQKMIELLTRFLKNNKNSPR